MRTLTICLLGSSLASVAYGQPEGQPFSCRVVDGEGRPLSGGVVIVPRFGTSFSKTYATRTDEHGIAVFQDVSQERPPLIAIAWRDGYTTITRKFADAERTGVAPTLQLRKISPLRVRILDPVRRPLKSVQLSFVRRSRKAEPNDTATPESGPYSEALQPFWRPTVETDEQGRAELPWAADGDNLVTQPAKDGYASDLISLAVPKEQDRVILVAPEARVRGRLVDAAGKPLSNVELRLASSERLIRTASDGTFVIDRLGGRAVNLSLVGTVLTIPPRMLRPRSGEDLNLGDVQALPAGTLSGKITVPKASERTVQWYKFCVTDLSAGENPGKAWTQQIWVYDSRAFEIRVFPGRYRVSLCTPGREANPEYQCDAVVEMSKTTTLNIDWVR